MTSALLVEQPGMMTTVQDLGRFGYQNLGVSVAGALDPVSLRLANALVGNEQGEAGLELRFLGPTLRVVNGPVRIALVGTDACLEVLEPEAFSVAAGQSVLLEKDSLFRVGAIPDTSCCFLAVEGGLDLPLVLGSRATHQPSGLGGFQGRALAQGDQLDLRADTVADRSERELAELPIGESGDAIRVVLGPQDMHFTNEAIETLLSNAYQISQQSSRMALRLDGPRLEHRAGHDIASDGIVTGAIQVPGTGQPIALLPDRQTTGGYPKIATVISADLPKLGRLRPGDAVRFNAVDVVAAEAIRRDHERSLMDAIDAIRDVSVGPRELARRLMRENLISGISG